MGRFFENFERICKAKGTSPSAAALSIGRSKNASSNWKLNGTIPKEDELEALAEHLGCHVSDFFIPEPQTKRGKDYMTYYMLMLDSENEGIDDAVKAAVEASRDAFEAGAARSDLVAEYKLLGNGSKRRKGADKPAAEGPALDDYERDFVRVYAALGPKDRMKLMNLVYEFADEKGVDL